MEVGWVGLDHAMVATGSLGSAADMLDRRHWVAALERVEAGEVVRQMATERRRRARHKMTSWEVREVREAAHVVEAAFEAVDRAGCYRVRKVACQGDHQAASPGIDLADTAVAAEDTVAEVEEAEASLVSSSPFQ